MAVGALAHRSVYFFSILIFCLTLVHACLVVRSHFQAAAENDLAFASIIQTRASLCELLALKMLRHFTTNHVELAAVLTMSWNPLQGAPAYVVDEVKQEIGNKPEDLDNPMSALEMAISTQSKQFLSSPLVQNVINDIWAGRILLSSASSHALVRDDYKTREITTYDFRNEPFLDHYRLRVPKYRAILEFMNFALLLFFFVVCLSSALFSPGWIALLFTIHTPLARDLARLTIPEGLFMSQCLRFPLVHSSFSPIVFAFGFILDEFAASQVSFPCVGQVCCNTHVCIGTRLDK